jgi:hypothetical protein
MGGSVPDNNEVRPPDDGGTLESVSLPPPPISGYLQPVPATVNNFTSNWTFTELRTLVVLSVDCEWCVGSLLGYLVKLAIN